MRKNRFFFLSTSILSCLLLQSCGNFAYLNNPFYLAPHQSKERWEQTKEEERSIARISTKTLPELLAERGALTLSELVDFALSHNPLTYQTWADARNAAASYEKTLGAFFPNITGSFNYQRSYTEVFLGMIAQETYITTWGPAVSLAFTIYDFGERRATSNAALQALYYANQTHNRNLETVVRTVALSYFDYLYQLELMTAYEEDIITAEETLRDAVASREEGVKSVSDELQAKTSLLSSKTLASQQEQIIQESLSGLLKTIGANPSQIPDLKRMPKTLPDMVALPSLDNLKEQALNQRSDYLALKNQLLSQKQSLLAAKRAVLPTVTWNFDAQRNLPAQGIPINTSWNSALALSFPIFAGFTYRNAIKEAEAGVEKAEGVLLEREINVVQDVVNAHSRVSIAHRTALLAYDYLKAAEENYEVEITQYKTGINTIVDVLVAQGDLADARSKYVSSLKDWYASLIELAYALGSPNPAAPLMKYTEEAVKKFEMKKTPMKENPPLFENVQDNNSQAIIPISEEIR